MNTPLRVGDKVHNPTHGTGYVTGFVFPEGQGEWVEVAFDASHPALAYWFKAGQPYPNISANLVSMTVNIERADLRRVLGTRDGALVLGR